MRRGKVEAIAKLGIVAMIVEQSPQSSQHVPERRSGFHLWPGGQHSTFSPTCRELMASTNESLSSASCANMRDMTALISPKPIALRRLRFLALFENPALISMESKIGFRFVGDSSTVASPAWRQCKPKEVESYSDAKPPICCITCSDCELLSEKGNWIRCKADLFKAFPCQLRPLCEMTIVERIEAYLFDCVVGFEKIFSAKLL